MLWLKCIIFMLKTPSSSQCHNESVRDGCRIWFRFETREEKSLCSQFLAKDRKLCSRVLAHISTDASGVIINLCVNFSFSFFFLSFSLEITMTLLPSLPALERAWSGFWRVMKEKIWKYLTRSLNRFQHTDFNSILNYHRAKKCIFFSFTSFSISEQVSRELTVGWLQKWSTQHTKKKSYPKASDKRKKNEQKIHSTRSIWVEIAHCALGECNMK